MIDLMNWKNGVILFIKGDNLKKNGWKNWNFFFFYSFTFFIKIKKPYRYDMGTQSIVYIITLYSFSHTHSIFYKKHSYTNSLNIFACNFYKYVHQMYWSYNVNIHSTDEILKLFFE